MPEYLAPGVFVEEVSFRQKTIEGVSTSTTGFVGPTRFGPMEGEPELLTSFADFERIYGGLDQMQFRDNADALLDPSHNDVAHAVRAYFEEGGKRLFVARVYKNDNGDGIASWQPSTSADVTLEARHPGAAGNTAVHFLFKKGKDVLGEAPVDPSDLGGTTEPVLRGVAEGDVVVATTDSPPGEDIYWLESVVDGNTGRSTFRLRDNDPDGDASSAVGLDEVDEVRRLTVSVTVGAMGLFSDDQVFEDLGFHPGQRGSLGETFKEDPSRRSIELFVPLVFKTGLGNGADVAKALLTEGNVVDGTAVAGLLDGSDAQRTFRAQLTGGSDGQRPAAGDYEGDEGSDGRKSGLLAFEDLEDISIVAAPGSTRGYGNGYKTNADTILRSLISHCERMRYRIAVLDSGDGQLPSEALTMRGTFDSTRAAFYYPWVKLLDPVTENEIHLPPSGFISGIYARTDVERGVHKAPANEVVRLAAGFELLLNKGQQETLNPEGVNALRFFEGRGYRVWGARTATSDPEWKYVNVRRYFAFLERSIEKGTQWAVFEPNGEILWANVQQTVSDFLFNEWMSNHLLGTKPEQAFFVRCDRSTMTQNDIDNGRLVCLIGVAPLRPAEFVIFRIGQKTADSQG